MSNDLVLTAPDDRLSVPANPFLTIIERCVLDPNFSVEKLGALLAIQKEWEALEAKKAFDEAKAKFSSFAVQVSKDKENKQYGSRYTSIGNLVNTVTPFLAQCNLNARWETEQAGAIKVTCILRHIKGHEEKASMIVPPDTSGGDKGKNPIQQIKSAMTYARICTFEQVCGLASRDGNADDDGNGASNGDLAEQIEWLQNARDVKELQSLFVEAYKKFDGNKNAQGSLIKAKDARKRELQ
jgi:ERF superfamily